MHGAGFRVRHTVFRLDGESAGIGKPDSEVGEIELALWTLRVD